MKELEIPGLGLTLENSGLIKLGVTSDGHFRVGESGVSLILATGDLKVEFVVFNNHTLACVKSAMDYPAYYPVNPVKMKKPVQAVLLELKAHGIKLTLMAHPLPLQKPHKLSQCFLKVHQVHTQH